MTWMACLVWQVPPDLGFATSEWRPTPGGVSGKRRLENYRATLTGNGLQPGYAASILFQVREGIVVFVVSRCYLPRGHRYGGRCPLRERRSFCAVSPSFRRRTCPPGSPW